MMRPRELLLIGCCLCVASLAAAQDAVPVVASPPTPYLKGRFLLGATWGPIATLDDDLSTHYKVSLFFRPNIEKRGWGPAIGLNWLRADLRDEVRGERTTVGVLRVRPVMAGVGYSISGRRWRVTPGAVAGYAFVSADPREGLPAGATADISVSHAWAAGPRIDTMVAVTRRLALVAGVTYVWTRPDVTTRLTFPDGTTTVHQHHVRGDSVSLRVGVAVPIF